MSEPQRKIFVLDTSVILHDFNALQNFQEHDVAIPITVLEELDQFKKGNSVLNLQAREFIRQLDKLSDHNMLHEWIPARRSGARPVPGAHRRERRGSTPARSSAARKADHRILNTALEPRPHRARPPGHPGQQGHQPAPEGAGAQPAGRGLRDGQDQGPRPPPQGEERGRGRRRRVIDRLYQEESLPFEAVLAERPRRQPVLHPAQRLEVGPRLLQPGDRPHRAGGQAARLRHLAAQRRADLRAPRRAQPGRAARHPLRRRRHRQDPARPRRRPSSSGGTSARSTWRGRSCRSPTATSAILPGDIQSKINPYMQPLWDNLGIIKNQFDEKRAGVPARSTRWWRPRSSTSCRSPTSAAAASRT